MPGDPAKVAELSSAFDKASGSPARRVARDDGFGRSSRFYDVGGRKYPSVTTILHAVNKPALVNWAARTERELVLRAAADLYEDLPADAPKMTRVGYSTSLENRVGKEKAHARELSRASDLGSAVHALIEWNMRKELLQEVGPEPKVLPAGLWAFMAYEDWRKAANLAPALVEQVVVSERYGYAGTMDWAGSIDAPGWRRGDEGPNRIHVVGDFKTGKAIYDEALLQNAAYVHALVEMGLAAPGTGGLIVRLPKVETDPAFETLYVAPEEQKRLFKVFLAVMDLWKWMEERDAAWRERTAAK